MNLALQKRHEQLERWRQNEENVELNQKLLHQVSDEQDPSNIKQATNLNRSSSASNSPTTRSKVNINFDDNILNNEINPSSKRRGTNKKGKSNAELQVKFSNSTLFLAACANGDLNECERLLKDNLVKIDVTTSEGLTGLHQAAICGNAQLVEFLIKSGANINCCDNEGWTPLHAASSLGLVPIVTMLLDYDADATIVNCENLLAYDLARNEQVQAIIGEHLQDVDIDYLRTQEERAIQKDIERWIRTGQYDERSHPLTNATVLHVLAAKGHINLMKQILETPILKKQINLEATDNEGFTPLLAASFWSQTEIVELLIEHGANIFAQAHNGYKISSIIHKISEPNEVVNDRNYRGCECTLSSIQKSVNSINISTMSRNPYLAASRPSSSYTRSSRTSKRNDLPSSRSSLLGRSRSSATLSGLSNQLGSVSSYSSSSYTPSSSTWQRSSSTNRIGRQGNDLARSSTTSFKASDYVPSNNQSTSKGSTYESSRPTLYKSISTQNLDTKVDTTQNEEEKHTDSDHLKNYQQSKLQESQTGVRSSFKTLDSKDSKASTTSLDSAETELSYDDSESIRSGSAPRHLRQGNLLKSQSLDIGQPTDTSTLLSGSMSVDRLLLRSENMTERELRKSYKELAMENERLKRHLKSIDEREKQKQQDWIRKERQMERKISELEEENQQLEQWKQESQRLKDENSSLIRVLSKLSKKH